MNFRNLRECCSKSREIVKSIVFLRIFFDPTLLDSSDRVNERKKKKKKTQNP